MKIFQKVETYNLIYFKFASLEDKQVNGKVMKRPHSVS